jgi:hypothetical protein
MQSILAADKINFGMYPKSGGGPGSTKVVGKYTGACTFQGYVVLKKIGFLHYGENNSILKYVRSLKLCAVIWHDRSVSPLFPSHPPYV